MSVRCFTFFWLLVTILVVPGTQAGLREDFGLVALWTFDSGSVQGKVVEDVFGENDGTIVGNPKGIQGFSGNALEFNGTEDYVQIANDLFFPSVTMEAIIRPTLGTRNPIYDKYNYGIQLLDNGDVGIWIRADTNVNNQWPSAYTPFPTDGKWHHVVGVAESEQEVRIYLDGQRKTATPAPDPISVAYGAQVRPSIAYTRHLGGIWYEGDIDEVAIYEGALNDDQVKKLYAESLAIEPAGRLAIRWGRLKVR